MLQRVARSPLNTRSLWGERLPRRTLSPPMRFTSGGRVSAVVANDGNNLLLERFGPKIDQQSDECLTVTFIGAIWNRVQDFRILARANHAFRHCVVSLMEVGSLLPPPAHLRPAIPGSIADSRGRSPVHCASQHSGL